MGERQIDPFQERLEAIEERLERLTASVERIELAVREANADQQDAVVNQCRTRLLLGLLWLQVNLNVMIMNNPNLQRRAAACNQYARETSARIDERLPNHPDPVELVKSWEDDIFSYCQREYLADAFYQRRSD